MQHLGLVALVIASGLMLAWPEIQNLLGRQSAVGTLEATQLINQKHAIILDLRREQDFTLGHLPSARHIPMDELTTRFEEISRFKSRPAILVTTGQNGPRAVKILKTQGFEDVFVLQGGVAAWIEANLPIETTRGKT
ncbi:MAG: rhodanese-like domain-containing protein [Betaproteobacteria bacterium]|nr:rhodanese-like domain-containing protein [Betaproteobacteria bacterium]